MEYVTLGDAGLKVSQICLGMMSFGDPGWRDWVLPERDAEPLVKAAVDGGVNFFDTADVYSLGASEVVTGRLLRKAFTRREEFVVATKVFFPTGDGPNDAGLSRRHILASVDASLERLGLDYIDLYQIHRWDHSTPIEETMEALDDVIRAGKVRYIGASSMYAWQFAKAQYTADLGGWTRFVSMQNHYNLLYREEEREMIPLCVDMGVGLLPWSPLARGLLARPSAESKATPRGKSDAFTPLWYDDPEHDPVITAVGNVAEERGLPRAQVALAWLVSRPGVVAPIVGTTKLRHLEDAIAALSVTLTVEEISSLESPYRTRPVAGH